jgi:capsular exopolysaccharide synthesis family protein
MSKFFRALEQAKRDRAFRNEAQREPDRIPRTLPAESVQSPSSPAPQFAAEVEEGLDQRLVSLVAPAAFEAEQYRALRHIVEQLHRTADLKVIAVSSPGMGDGKTVTSINLAGALAQAPEARVLLIDADLRRPALGRLLSLGATGGADLVGAMLDHRLTLEQIIQPRPPFNLSVICAGQTPPSPYEVLKSPRLGELIEEARRQYDFVIIDTPPLAPVQDCRIIGRWVDGFLLVVAAHRTPRRLLEETLATLDHTKILGIVFNQDDRPVSGHYSGYYDGYSSLRQPSLNGGGPRAALGRAVKQIGDSLRRHHRRAGSSRRRSARGPR